MKKLLLILVVLTLLSAWPFFKKGYFTSHDGEWMVIRFSAFHQTLRSGQFPVRFVDRLYNNYGYPVINFLYPLPFYTSEIWKLVGFGFVDSVKITFVLSTLASSLAMFWALSQQYEPLASLAGSIVYIYVPYRFVDLYVRGSIGENMAFAFLPLIFGSIYKIKKKQKIFWPILAFSITGLILSHNVIAFIFIPVFFTYALLVLKSHYKKLITFFLMGVIAAAFFWVPALTDLKYVAFPNIDVSQATSHLVSISKLILPIWGYGPNPNNTNPLPVQLGMVTIGVFLALTAKRILEKRKLQNIDFFLLTSAIAIVLMTTLSTPLWQISSFSKLIQFPWRLLSIIVFSSSVFAAYLINNQKNAKILFLIISVAAICSTIAYSKPDVFVNRQDSYYSTNESSTTVLDEYLPVWVKQKPVGRADRKVEISKGVGAITSQTIKPSNYQFDIKADSSVNITIKSFYFPGWIVKLGNQNISTTQDIYGLIGFSLPQGSHKVHVYYGLTAIHLMSELLSTAAICYLLLITFYSFIKIKNHV